MVLAMEMQLVDLERFQRSLGIFEAGWRRRVFTQREWELGAQRRNRCETLAARFAAKSCARRALGSKGIPLRDIEVIRSEAGVPSLRFFGRASERARELGVVDAALTLTHDGGLAMALVLLEGEER